MTTLERAKHEYAETGTICTDTYMALNNEGFNADIVLAQLAGEIDNG
jgi:hypothetical protein